MAVRTESGEPATANPGASSVAPAGACRNVPLAMTTYSFPSDAISSSLASRRASKKAAAAGGSWGNRGEARRWSSRKPASSTVPGGTQAASFGSTDGGEAVRQGDAENAKRNESEKDGEGTSCHHRRNAVQPLTSGSLGLAVAGVTDPQAMQKIDIPSLAFQQIIGGNSGDSKLIRLGDTPPSSRRDL